MTQNRLSLAVLSIVLFSSLLSGCSSTRPVKAQAYAKLNSERTFENDLPTVWKAIDATFRNFKIVSRDPFETDWIYSQSRDKYVEYKVNNFPRKQYLQTRLKYLVKANSVMGGVHVEVVTTEEVEKLKENGTPAGYDASESPDSSRANEILEKIQNSILSAAP